MWIDPGNYKYCYSITIAHNEYLLGWFDAASMYSSGNRTYWRWRYPDNLRFLHSVTGPDDDPLIIRADIDAEVERMGLRMEDYYRAWLAQNPDNGTERLHFGFGCLADGPMPPLY